MFHLFIWTILGFIAVVLTKFFKYKTSLIICATKPFILKMHGNMYIDDYEGLVLKRTWNYIIQIA